MINIAFIGTGSMGSRMAQNLINAGYNVSIWNRNADRAIPLIENGARQASTPREASKDADLVISMLRDDEASKFAWCDEQQGALIDMKPGAIAIDCSTLSVAWVKQLAQECAKREIDFLDAPVAGSRPQAEAAQLIFFVGGKKSVFEQTKSVFETMGSATHYAGLNGAGAGVKLAVNVFFGVQLTTMAELIGLMKASGLDANHMVEILASTPVCSPATKLASGSMLSGNFTPMFPIELVEKDFSYAMLFAKENGVNTPMTNTAWHTFQHAMNEGFGTDNITGVAQLYMSRT